MKRESSGKGVGFFGLLAIVFITLKLVGVITWSWWFVLMPIWVHLLLGLIVVVVLVVLKAWD